MKATGSRAVAFSRHVFPIAICVLLLGCQSDKDWSLTHRLWTDESFRNFKMPAPEPRLQLFADESQSDVLVVYDEVCESNEAVRRRAFFANRNLDRIREGKKPRFVSCKVADGLNPIPIVHSGSSETVPAAGLSVVMMENPHEFVVYSEGRELGPVGLPTYGSGGGIKKAFLTPLTVTGDTLIVGTVVGLYAVLIYAQSGASFSVCH